MGVLDTLSNLTESDTRGRGAEEQRGRGAEVKKKYPLPHGTRTQYLFMENNE